MDPSLTEGKVMPHVDKVFETKKELIESKIDRGGQGV